MFFMMVIYCNVMCKNKAQFPGYSRPVYGFLGPLTSTQNFKRPLMYVNGANLAGERCCNERS